MICESCTKQYQGESFNSSYKGYCHDCGTRLKFGHILEGYWKGVAFSGIVFFILIFSTIGNIQFLAVNLIGHALSFGLLYWFVKLQGRTYYISKSQYAKNRFAKQFIGIVIGGSFAFLWFFVAAELIQEYA